MDTPTTPPTIEPLAGIVPAAKLPAHTYHQRSEISKHGLDDIDRCPAWYQHCRAQPHTPTPTMRFGSLLHLVVLEPERFAAEVAVVPADMPPRPSERSMNAKKPSPETAEAAARWRKFEAEHVGREIVTGEENARLDAMRLAVMRHPSAGRLLAPGTGQVESSIFWTDPETGVGIRSRLDFAHHKAPLIVDLKKTEDASRAAFMRSVDNYRYDVQAALYVDGWQAVTGEKRDFVFVAVEDKEPYLVACYVATPQMLEAGRLRYRRNLNTYAQCLRTGVWPGLGDAVQELDLPAWRMKELFPLGQ